jgi:hypothetical protein
LANELSRISERLIRARERNGHGAARVWVPPPARREPTRRELPPEPRSPAKPRDDAAQSQKASSTWVAIHVQLRHEPAPAETVFDAPSDRDEDDDEEIYVDAAPVEFATPLHKALPAPAASEAFFVPKVLASETAAPGNRTRATGILHYLATRALNAYLSQSSFASVAASEPRMLDVHA